MIASVPMDFCRLSREDLKANEVHVWSACLDLKQQYVDSLENLLSTDEQQRAGRFCFWRDRNRFIVGRGLLRVCLSRYLDREPREIEFRYGTQGKPELVARSQGAVSLPHYFNVTHSAHLALFAIACERDIGIDMEQLRSDLEVETLAAHCLSRVELYRLLALPVALRPEAFLRCWTLKEACLKARGAGLSAGLDQFHMSFPPDETPSLPKGAGNSGEASRWFMAELVPAPDFLGTLVVRGGPWLLRWCDSVTCSTSAGSSPLKIATGS